jgi:hypothetical protein
MWGEAPWGELPWGAVADAVVEAVTPIAASLVGQASPFAVTGRVPSHALEGVEPSSISLPTMKAVQ